MSNYQITTLHRYALYKTFFDKGRDYIDSFLPFVLRVLKEDAGLSKEDILGGLESSFKIKMPYHVLDTILDRLVNMKYVRVRNKHYTIRKIGVEYRDEIDDERYIEAKINALMEDIYQETKETYEINNVKEIRDIIFGVIRNNLHDVVDIINPSMELEHDKIELHKELDLVHFYSILAEEKKPDHYKTFREMVFGSLISLILYTRGSLDLQTLSTKKMSDVVLYLDTNYIIFLLELESKEFTQPAVELYNLISLNDIQLKVFEFTVNELARVFSGYGKKLGRYPENVEIGHLYSHLKRAGWTKSSVREFIINIDSILKEKNIQIDSEHSVNPLTYRVKNPVFIEKIIKYKPDLSKSGIIHDLISIDIIEELRKKPKRRFENTKHFFLTSDLKLNEFNYVEMRHKENGTIGEVISDRALTNLLWLKNPQSMPSLSSIIATHAKEVLIKPSIWEAFYNNLSKLKEDGTVSDDDITMLFYDNNMEDMLKTYNESDVGEINEEFILENIEKARDVETILKHELTTSISKEYDEKIKEVEKGHEEILRKQKTELEKSKIDEIGKIKYSNNEEWLVFYKDLKERTKNTSEKESNLYSLILSGFITVLYVFILFTAWNYCTLNNILENYKFIISVLGLGGITGIFTRVRKELKQVIQGRLFNEKMNELNISELEKVKKL